MSYENRLFGKSLLETILDGFQTTHKNEKQQELQLAEIAAETEYQSCLMELNNELL